MVKHQVGVAEGQMNYSALKKCDIANGIGFRLSLWCSGCSRRCKGCFNPEAQDPNFGKEFDEVARHKVMKELADEHCSGLSLLGGEPLYISNRSTMIELCREVKQKFPEKDIWLWSGFLFEDILKDETMKPILTYIDVLVDGEFVISKKDLSTPFRGSTNQRLLDVADWRRTGELHELKLK